LLEFTKKVILAGDAQTVRDATDPRRQNGPQSNKHPDCATTSEMILYMNSEIEFTNSSHDISCKSIRKTNPFMTQCMRYAMLDKMNGVASLMEEYKFCPLGQVSHTRYRAGNHFRLTRRIVHV